MNTIPTSVDISNALALLHSISWTAHATQGRQGAMIHYLHRDTESGQSVALVRFGPQSSAPTHEHLGHESIVVLEGSYEDDYGSHATGQLVVYPPGSHHSWRSPEGALLYVVWGGPTRPTVPDAS